MTTNDQKWLTLHEASIHTGYSVPTLRRMITNNKLKAKKVSFNKGSRIVIKTEYCDEIKAQRTSVDHDHMITNDQINTDQAKPNKTEHCKARMASVDHDQMITNDHDQANVIKGDQPEALTPNIIKDILDNKIDQILQTKQNQLMKPIEQQALFIAGKLTQENRELKEKLETVVTENALIRERIKLLPAAPEEIIKEMEALKTSLREAQEARREAQKAKDGLSRHIDELKALEIKLQNEKKQAAEQAREEIDRLKSELDEERDLPWWKKLFGKNKDTARKAVKSPQID